MTHPTMNRSDRRLIMLDFVGTFTEIHDNFSPALHGPGDNKRRNDESLWAWVGIGG